MNQCLDCNRQLAKRTIARCWNCYLKYLSERPSQKAKYYCIDCDIQIYDKRATRCFKCARKNRQKRNCVDCGKYIKRGGFRCQDCHFKHISIPKIYCIDCGKQRSKSRLDKGAPNLRCRSCANKHRWKTDPAHIGTWRGGISFLPYPPEFNKSLKELIRFRDGYKCQRCGCPEIEEDRKLTVHHVDHDPQNCDPSNLITLCLRCNVRDQNKKDQAKWQRIFHRKIQKLMSTHPLQLNFRVAKSHVKNRSQGRSS